mgnify:CR=1 FL=1
MLRSFCLACLCSVLFVSLADAQTTSSVAVAAVTPSPSAGMSIAAYPASKAITTWPTGKKLIALTFDDGPNPAITPKMIALLERKNAKGTFFLAGKFVSAYPQVVREYLTRPCAEIANHTWSHPQLSKISPDAVASEIEKTSRAIMDCGCAKPTLVRPPYGATNATVNELIRSKGYVPVLWDIDTNDWRKRSAAQISEQILREAHDGAIVLMHDRFESDLVALETVIDDLQGRGFVFVTVSEMLSQPRTTLPTFAAKSNASKKASSAQKTQTRQNTGSSSKTSKASKSKSAGNKSSARKAQATPAAEVFYQQTPKPRRGLRKLLGRIAGRD